MDKPQFDSELGASPVVRTESICRNCDRRFDSLCGVLNCDELDILSEMMEHQFFEAKDTIIYEEDEAKNVYNIAEGILRLTKLLPDGRRLVTGFLYPGDFVGLAFHDNYSYSVEAVTEVKVCRFPRLKLEALLKEIPKLESKLLGMMSNELKEAQDQMMLLGRKSPKERLASFLLNISQRKIEKSAGPARDKLLDKPNNSFELPMSRMDISDYLGLTIETVSRTLTTFTKNGIISTEGRKKINILNREKLEDIADGDLA
ncbi:MAG: helix-turn-helix domain-containing protein, partial [Sphingomonadales bacterium]|nr:helix-turn-helix domain-containing protein [Sphingomonadales bacterium]